MNHNVVFTVNVRCSEMTKLWIAYFC